MCKAPGCSSGAGVAAPKVGLRRSIVFCREGALSHLGGRGLSYSHSPFSVSWPLRKEVVWHLSPRGPILCNKV